MLRVRDAASGAEQLRLNLVGERVRVTAFSADSRHLLTGNDNGEVKVRRVDTGEVVRVLGS